MGLKWCPHKVISAHDRDLESAFTNRKVNARMCAPRSTDRDLQRQREFFRECLDMCTVG